MKKRHEYEDKGFLKNSMVNPHLLSFHKKITTDKEVFSNPKSQVFILLFCKKDFDCNNTRKDNFIKRLTSVNWLFK